MITLYGSDSQLATAKGSGDHETHFMMSPVSSTHEHDGWDETRDNEQRPMTKVKTSEKSVKTIFPEI
jgi:hypothetical protein